MAEFPITIPEDKPNVPTALSEAGFIVREHNGQFLVQAEDQAEADFCQSWIDSFDAVAYAKAAALKRLDLALEIKLAGIEVASQQIALLTEALRLTVQNCGTAFASWPASPRNRMTTLNTRLTRINDTTTAHGLIAGDIAAMTDVHEIDAFDPMTSSRWPVT